MGFLERFRAKAARSGHAETAASPVAPGPPITVRVAEDTHTYQGNDGKRYWSGGYAPVYDDGSGEHHFLRPGEPLSNPRALYCTVAGVQHYSEALQDSRFAPMSPLKLIPEPDNPYDPNAVRVRDGSGSVQVGHIPRDLSAEVAERIRSGEQLAALVLREIRLTSKSGRRWSLHIIVMPTGELTLSIVED